MPLLSLCLIARDEADLLPGCLASVAPVCDELIVVDTGSTDATPTIARDAGAQVVAHPWRDDFAAARNAAVAAARGRFVLVLDADERLAAAGLEPLRAALVGDDFDGAFLPLHNADRLDADEAAVLSGAARRGEPVLLPRLLRRMPTLRWEGLVHEHVDAWLRGRPVRALDAPLIHLGYVDAIRIARDKGTRNRRLLERVRDADPARLRPRVELVRELLLAGDHASAAVEARAAWALLLDAPPAPAPECLVALTTLRTWIALHEGALDDAAAVLDVADARGAAHANLDLLRGHVLELQALGARGTARVDRLLRARACFARCLAHAGELSTETLSPGATSWSAATRLGTVLLLLGEAALAREAFAFAVTTRPDHLEARLGRVEALLDGGDPEGAIAALEPLLPDGPLDAWILAVAAAHALQRQPLLVALLARGRDYLSRGLVAPHRRERLDGLGRLLAA